MSYIVAGLTLLALAIVVAGFGLSRRSRRPNLLRVGTAITALGLVLLWLLPFWLFSADRGELAMPMFIAILFVVASVLGLGLHLTARACGAPESSRNDDLVDEFIRRNDLP